jgi:quercetin dioxygenase-like cupin family protein
MRVKTNRLVLTVVVGCFVAVWRGQTDQDVTIAQARKTVVITRIFTGPDGLAHAEDIDVDLNARGATDMFKATGAEFSVRPPTAGAAPGSVAAAPANDAGWHTGPARQFVITLSGSSEVEVSGGVHVTTSPGHINLIEDTTGKGHITRNFGPGDRIALTIPLADGVVIPGARKPRTR